MCGKWLPRLAAICGVLALWMGVSEAKIRTLRANFSLLQEFRTIVSDRSPLCPVDICFPNQSQLKATLSWSAGNKTYRYFRLARAGRVVLDFWGTNSVTSEPEVWVECGRGRAGVCEFLTYQPCVLETSTPYGQVRSGYRLWRFDGVSYQDSPIGLCPLNEWIGNPIPLQD